MTDEPSAPERPVRPATSPSPTRRTTRLSVAAPPKSFFERYRNILLGAVGVVALLGIGGIALFNAAQPAYACAERWAAPAATDAPAPGASPRLGYIQPDLGKNHITVGPSVNYPLCPPASGRHYNASNLGPIKAIVYGPDDTQIPQGWLHNLEHGGLIILYKCPGDACEEAGQAALRQLYASFPTSPVCNLPVGAVGPVIARFDQMEYPYVAMLWGQVLPLQTLDTAQILAFFTNQAERSNPEAGCPRPTATPAPTRSAAPSASQSASPAGSPAASPVATPAASTAPSPAASPGTSPAPS